jgi:recombinational DNA repair protein (RecF pathway)
MNNILDDEEMYECVRCANTYTLKEMSAKEDYSYCKKCVNEITANYRFLKKLEKLVITDEMLLKIFNSTDEFEIREKIEKMSDKEINIILKMLLKKRINWNQIDLKTGNNKYYSKYLKEKNTKKDK